MLEHLGPHNGLRGTSTMCEVVHENGSGSFAEDSGKDDADANVSGRNSNFKFPD